MGSQAYPSSSAVVLEPTKKCAPGKCKLREVKKERLPVKVRIFWIFTSRHYFFDPCCNQQMKRMRIIRTYLCDVCNETSSTVRFIAFCEKCQAEESRIAAVPLIVNR